ncbi:toxin-antitoxin system toxin subunit, partial [Candidatus Fermentibacteria bacterium]
EWREINEKGNSFILNIRSQPKIFLIGNENDL